MVDGEVYLSITYTAAVPVSYQDLVPDDRPLEAGGAHAAPRANVISFRTTVLKSGFCFVSWT